MEHYCSRTLYECSILEILEKMCAPVIEHAFKKKIEHT